MQDQDQPVAAQQWTTLDQLSTAELRQKWLALFGDERAPRLRRQLLIAALAYEIQARALGGLKVRTRHKLRRLAEHPDTPMERKPPLAPGTQLVREWQGQTYRVEVGTDEFYWQGKNFKSLSAIARQITGTRWSGPRFFGLNDSKAGATT